MTRLSDSKLHPTGAAPRKTPRALHFHKLQGAGNDFVVLDLISHPLAADFDFPRAALALCNRHLGAGSDGLLTLEAANDGSEARMRMWNPDGSEDMCGNGLRCVAHLTWLKKIVTTPVFRVQTLVGARQIEVLKSGWIRAEMGLPRFEPSQIPLAIEDEIESETGGGKLLENALDIEIALPDRTFAASSLSTGSTHTVIFLPAPLSDADFHKFGPLLENHPLFPARTSVMFAVARGANRFDLRIWERGAGETWACGTGACAVGVAAQMTGRARGAVQIRSKGGELEVEWTPGEAIFLTGPARAVFEARGDFSF